MIGRLRGIIIEKQPPLVLIEVGGVGYEVHMPMTCFYELPEAGQEAIVFTHFVVREDAQLPIIALVCTVLTINKSARCSKS
ncbi:hypothetical protein EIMP300_46940 [Escherichia coli]|uniref:DNA helicase Holliday junction RuvA type domain-containing protein n=1 Tax=Escherichia coli TaxID=562 RepID=A0A8S0FSC2_ECOLX|nr:hypothetical protein EIMP300_46940 [Escherichia coli]